MQKLFILLACAIVLKSAFAEPTSSSSIHSQRYKESLVLTLPVAIEKALQSNPELALASREINALEGALMQAGTPPNPEIAMLLEDTRKETRNTTVQLNQQLELGGKRSARINAAQQDIELAAADLLAKRDEIRATVITAFYDTLGAQERYRLALESVDLAKRATTAAVKRVSAGKVSPIEEVKARVAEAGVMVELAQAEANLNNARKQLTAMWGGTIPTFEHVDGRMDELTGILDIQTLRERLKDSPLFKRLDTEIKKRQALVTVEKSKQIPDVTLSLGVKKNNELGFNQTIIGLSVPLPLFDRNQGNLREALRREDKARDEFALAKVRAEAELSQIYQRVSLNYREAQLLEKEVLPGAKRAYEAATQGYELGKFNFLEVLDAQRTLFQVRAQYLKALSDAHRATAELERLIGMAQPSSPGL